MATDKKSFLLYCDIVHMVEQLTDEQAGNLFKHILQYVNDKNPVTDNVITRIAFEPIKQSLKRDLLKYEGIRERNRENARKRWDATACDRIPNYTKNADSVSDSVSVSVIKENIKEKAARFTPPTLDELKAYMKQQGMEDLTERFYDFYQAKGWMVGKNKMKDWKAAVRTWKKPEQVTTTSKPIKATLNDD